MDLMQRDVDLTSDERLVRDTVRRFVNEEVLPQIAQHYEQGHFPREWVKRLAELGLFGIRLPSALGGAQASHVVYGLVCQELERGDSGLRSFFSVQNALVIYPLFRYGSEAHQQRYLPGLIAGELIGCFGLTEPNAGSDPNSMQTTAKKVENGYVLNGQKTWITNAPIADIAIVWAKTAEGIRGFVLEKEQAQFEAKPIEHKLSMRASSTGELFLQDVFVSEEQMLPGTAQGLGTALACLTQARFGIAWGAMGAAEACYDIALNYTQQREQFGKPLAGNQLVQRDLVHMYTEICKAYYLNLSLGKQMDSGKSHFARVSLAKRNACTTALELARIGRSLLGGNGISLEYHVIRHLTNLETVITYEGTENIQTLIVGRELTGINAF